MNKPLFKAGCILSLPLLLTGCIDNSYDLSDIDTTSEIKINNLTLPINLDVVKLNDILNVSEDGKIKITTIDGKEIYAVSESGTISSDPINIPSFTAHAPTVSPAHANFLISGTRSGSYENLYELSDLTSQVIEIKASDINESIIEVSRISSEPMSINIELKAEGFDKSIEMEFVSLEFDFFKGLVFKELPSNFSYDATNGILTVTNLPCPNHAADITLETIGIDFAASGTQITNHTLDFTTEVKPRAGILKTVTPAEVGVDSPVMNIDFSVNSVVSDLHATSFTGVIEYNLDGPGMNLNPVNLSDIPDFISQEGTDIRLLNPQIYLNLNNPLAANNLYYQTGLELVALRDNTQFSYSPDNGNVIKVEPGTAGPFNFVLSPTMPSDALAGYASGLKHITFSELSNVLSGNGLPREIEINLINPGLPRQAVSDFALDREIPGIIGSYEFFAPLALSSGSVIIYSDTKDGWNDEDVDKMIITTLEIEADVTSTIPLKASLTGHPINTNGEPISGVTIEGAEIEANAQNQHILIRTTGEVRNLDGIRFEAVVVPGSSETLSPTQTLTLTNVHARVSGSYTTEF